MDYLNMWASNHRVQSSNPSDTGSAKHTAELGDNDPNHDKSVHSSTTAMSRLKRVINVSSNVPSWRDEFIKQRSES